MEKSAQEREREWIEKMAKLEENCESVSVGGLALKMGFIKPTRENYDAQKDNLDYDQSNNN